MLMPVPGESTSTSTNSIVKTPVKQQLVNAKEQPFTPNMSQVVAPVAQVKQSPIKLPVTNSMSKPNSNTNQGNNNQQSKANNNQVKKENNQGNNNNGGNKNQQGNNKNTNMQQKGSSNNNSSQNQKPGFDKNRFNKSNNQSFDKSKYHLKNNNQGGGDNKGNHGNNNHGGNNKFHHQNGGGGGGSYQSQQQQYHNNMMMDQGPVAEKKFTGRCRLFCGNLPTDLTEDEFKELFKKFGETGECFLNTQRSFGFIKLDTRINAEQAKQELDGTQFKNRTIRVRFATHGAAVRVKNLSPYISNEYLEQAFSMFGPVERAVVIVDDKGRPTGEGIVEFERKPASIQCINKCQENNFILTSYPRPIVVEPLEQKDEEDGLPEKSIIKNSQFYIEREVPAHFAPPNSNEAKLAMKWRELYELEKQINEEGKRRVDQAREMLEFEIEQALFDNKAMQLKEDLRAKQEELQRIENMRKEEFVRRQEMEMRRVDDERYRSEQMGMMRPGGGQQMQQGFNNQSNHQAGPQGNNNQRRGNPNNNNSNQFNQNNQQFQMDNNQLNNLPPDQQQAIIAAQLMMAAAAQQQQGTMFDNNGQQMNNGNFNEGNGGNSGKGNGNNGGHKSQKDEHRGGSNNNNRQRFNDRRNNNRAGNRDDSYPGFDTKRARF